MDFPRIFLGVNMNKLELYKMALSVLDLDTELTDLEPDAPTKELNLLNIYFNKCVLYVLKAWDFSFLVKRVKLTERKKEPVEGKDETDWPYMSWAQYKYGYVLPENFLRVVQINGTRKNAFAVRFGILWCEVENPTLEYIEDKISMDVDGNYLEPEDFLSLIAYQLALHIAPLSDPESSAQTVAAQLYQLTFSSILESENMSNDHEYNDGANNQLIDEMTRTEVLQAINRGVL